MKKIKLFIIPAILLTVLVNANIMFAQEGSEEETNGSVADDAQDAIERIKDAVASKVAELDLVEKRGFYGEITETSNTELTIKDKEGNQKIIEIDELTRFEGERQTEDFGVSDLSAGDQISAVGLYNKETEKLLARFITQNINIPHYITGAIKEIDDTNFTITTVTKEGDEFIIDIETSTNTSVLEEGELTASGFSQLAEGEKVIVSGFENQDEEGRISADRLLHFPQIPPSDEIKQHLTATSEENEDEDDEDTDENLEQEE